MVCLLMKAKRGRIQSQMLRVIKRWRSQRFYLMSSNSSIDAKQNCARSFVELHSFIAWYGIAQKRKYENASSRIKQIEGELFTLRKRLESYQKDSDSTPSTWIRDDGVSITHTSLQQNDNSYVETGPIPLQKRAVRSLNFEKSVSAEKHSYMQTRPIAGSAEVSLHQMGRNEFSTTENPSQLHSIASALSDTIPDRLITNYNNSSRDHASIDYSCEFSNVEKDRMELTTEIIKLQMLMENMVPKDRYDDLKEEVIVITSENARLKHILSRLGDRMVDKHSSERLKKENEHYFHENMQLKSCLDNMIPKSEVKKFESETMWLFQEIERIQKVVDATMIRALPEAEQLERCFVSAEICSSFCVRALIRLARVLDINPSSDKANELEYRSPSLDISVYD